MGKIALVGMGLVGRAWAISFARAGHEVALFDERREAVDAALAFADGALSDLDANGLLSGQSPAVVRARMRAAATLEDALADAEHVQESTPESSRSSGRRSRVSMPRRRPARRSRVRPRRSCPLISREDLPGRARCLVVHPINPPYLIPAVEVVPAPWTDSAVVERAAALLRAAGHAPIVMKREIDGFVMNRLQGALLEEAFRLVAQGYASAEDVDIGIRDGLALRWSFMGPFETIDLNAPAGVRDYAQRYQGIYRDIFPSAQWRADWSGPVMDEIEAERRVRLPVERLAERQAWRDRRLMALAAQKKKAAQEYGE